MACELAACRVQQCDAESAAIIGFELGERGVDAGEIARPRARRETDSEEWREGKRKEVASAEDDG